MLENCTPWAGYIADAWQRVCVRDMRTNETRSEVATDATERGGPLLARFMDEHGVQLDALQNIVPAQVAESLVPRHVSPLLE